MFSQVIVNKAELSAHIRRALQGVSQVTLRELCERHGEPFDGNLNERQAAERIEYLQDKD